MGLRFDLVAMSAINQVMGEPPSSWSVSKLSTWLGQDDRLDAEVSRDYVRTCVSKGRPHLRCPRAPIQVCTLDYCTV